MKRLLLPLLAALALPTAVNAEVSQVSNRCRCSYSSIVGDLCIFIRYN